MAEIHVSVDSSLPPEAVLGAATDFSKHRLEIWPTIDPEVYGVEALDEKSAVVREGTHVLGGLWAKERYDWSEDGVVRATVMESNTFRTGGIWQMTVRPTDVGGSHVELLWNRRGSGLKGLVVLLAMRLTGKARLEAGLHETPRLVEKARLSVRTAG